MLIYHTQQSTVAMEDPGTGHWTPILAHPIGLHFDPYLHPSTKKRREEAHQVGHLCAHVVPRGSIS